MKHFAHSKRTAVNPLYVWPHYLPPCLCARGRIATFLCYVMCTSVLIFPQAKTFQRLQGALEWHHQPALPPLKWPTQASCLRSPCHSELLAQVCVSLGKEGKDLGTHSCHWGPPCPAPPLPTPILSWTAHDPLPPPPPHPAPAWHLWAAAGHVEPLAICISGPAQHLLQCYKRTYGSGSWDLSL